jgi:hypothetical protein
LQDPIEINVDQHHVFVAKSDNSLDSSIHNIRFSKDQLQPSLLISFGCTIQQYVASQTKILLSKVFEQLLESTTEQADQPSHLQRNLWTRVKSTTLTSTRVESVFITHQQICENGEWMLVALNDGSVRQLSVDSLETISTYDIQRDDDDDDDDEDDDDIERPLKRLRMTFDNQPLPYVTSIAISPNHTCFAALLSSGRKVMLFALSPQDLTNPKEELIAKFELNILNNLDQWDLLIILRRFLNKTQVQELHSGLDRHRNEMSPSSRHFYTIRYERLFVLLNLLTGEDRLNQVVSTQANIFIMCIHDALRNYPFFATITSLDANMGIDNLIKSCEHVDAAVVRENLSALLPISNWIITYTLYLYRNIRDFVEKMSMQTTFIPPTSLYYSIHPLKNKTTITFVRDLVLFSYLFVHVYQTQPNQQQSLLQSPLLIKDYVKHIYSFMWEIWKHIDNITSEQTQEKHDVLHLKSNLDGLKNILKSQNVQALSGMLPSMDRTQMLNYLDLIPHFNGLLGKKKNKLNDICFDVITRNELRTNQVSYRRCKTCSRVSSAEIEGLAVRWAIACPMCAGYWSINEI